jgi:hypothetical protein
LPAAKFNLEVVVVEPLGTTTSPHRHKSSLNAGAHFTIYTQGVGYIRSADGLTCFFAFCMNNLENQIVVEFVHDLFGIGLNKQRGVFQLFFCHRFIWKRIHPSDSITNNKK